jgi:hypothetical protein
MCSHDNLCLSLVIVLALSAAALGRQSKNPRRETGPFHLHSYTLYNKALAAQPRPMATVIKLVMASLRILEMSYMNLPT